MLRLIEPHEFGYFDQLIAEASNPDFAQTTAWGRLKSATWRPLHFLYEANSVAQIAMTVWLRKPPVFPFLLAYAPRGPIFITERAEDYLPDLMAEMKTELHKRKAFALKVDPAWTDELLASQLEILGFQRVITDHPFGGTQPKFTFRLDISLSEDDLLAFFPKKTRYSIRYPFRKDVTYRLGTVEDLPLLMEVLQETSRRKKFLGREMEYYKQLLQAMGDKASLIVGMYEGEVVAAGVTVVCGRNAWAVYGGMKREFSNLRAYYGLNWQRMLWAKSKGATVFDFFGVPVDQSEGAPLYGLYQFKKSFGGELVEFIGEYEMPIRRWSYRFWRRFSPMAIKIWRNINIWRRGNLGDKTEQE